MEKIIRKIVKLVEDRKIAKDDAKELLKDLQGQIKPVDQEIAVIGMAGKFPEAENLAEFWENLVYGRNCVSPFSEYRRRDTDEIVKTYLGQKVLDPLKVYKQCGFLKQIDKFDAGFFRISPREAALIDPSHRLFLEIAWEAISDAGLAGQRLVGSNTGIFVGKDHSGEAMYKKMISESDVLVATGSWPGILASRLAYIFDFQGPCVVIDTACSSGLVAVHQACQAIKNKECELAIAGGVFVEFIPATGSQLGMIESPDVTIRSFDRAANGTIWGEGVGAVLLKPLKKALADGDPIHAIIKSSAINNDGASNGITAPKAEAQEKVILKAWQKMQINPETISYVETHGTGTVLGDPIEVKGLNNAFRHYTNKKQFCGIGSCKTNIGHLVGASGIASLIKVILSLKHGLLPASLNFQEPNPYIDFSNSPLYVNDRLQRWQVNGYPRRAGVNAFGFSGTNCHLVLEEAPAKVLSVTEDQPQLLTISARSKEVLVEFVQRYQHWIAEHPETNLADFCYTINTGRGHFSHRLALIIQDLSELQSKLAYLLRSGLNSTHKMDIYYAEHRIVNMNKRDRQPGELTKAEKQGLSKTGAEYLRELRELGLQRQKVAQIYVKGADLNWEDLYLDQKRQRLHLPTYPFLRKRHWLEPQVSKEYATVKRPVKEFSHPLLDRCLLDSLYQKVYLTEFSVEDHWVLQEHRVLGNYVLPGTTYLELIREAVKEDYPDGELELRDIYFLTPLIVNPGEKRAVQTIIDKRNEQREFTVASQDDLTGEWMVHIEGKIAPAKPLVEKKIDLEALKAGFLKSEAVQPKELKDRPIELGPRWANLRRIYYGEDEVMILLALDEEFRDDLEELLLHPAMMDTAVNSLSQSQGEGVYLPFSYKALRLYRSMPGKLYSYLRKSGKEQKNQEVFAADISLFDESGRIIAEITDYKVKKVRARDLTRKEDLYYQINWLERPLTSSNQRVLLEQKVLLLQSAGNTDQKLCTALDALGWTVYQAHYGTTFADLGSGNCRITGSEEDYRRLFDQLKEKGLTMVLHLASLETANSFPIQPVEDDGQQFIQFQHKVVKELFYLSRALTQVRLNNQLELFLITEGVNSISGREVIYPHNASLIGLGKVVRQEVGKIVVRAIDFTSGCNVEDLLAEIRTVGQPYQVSYRQGRRYVEEITSVKLEELPVRETKIHSSGVYLITGGTGGIGLEMAKYLAQEAKPNIVLINRSPLPVPELWDEIITSGEEKRLSKKLSMIRQIEALGARVLTYAIDVASYEEMHSLLMDLRKNFGRINGVIHAAGVAGDGLLQLKEESVFDEVLRPKLAGTWILDQLTRIDSPDFFVLCSSISSLVAGPGQGDYVAANAYLDGYAEYRNQLGYPTVAINWAAWQETGMAVDYQLNTDQSLFKGLTTKEAITAFSEILAHQLKRIVVGQLNYQHELFRRLDQIPLLFAPEIKAKISKYHQRSRITKGERKDQISSQVVQMKGRTTGEYSAIEKKLASIWGEILVLEEVDIYEDFYALGGDSLIAIKLSNAIKAVTEFNIDTSDIFQYQTIADLASYFSQQSDLPQSSDETVKERKATSKVFTLSKTQQRIWFLQKFNPQLTVYNLPTLFKIKGVIDQNLFQRAVNSLVTRHSALRTIFFEEEGIPQQLVLETLDLPIQAFDLTNEKDPEKALVELVAIENKKVFDLSKPLIRVIYYQTKNTETSIYLNLHHIIIDGWSMGIIIQELSELYENYAAGQSPVLASLGMDYENWLESQADWLSSEECDQAERYWLAEIEKPLPILHLPTDFLRPPHQTFNGSNVSDSFNQEMTEKLKELVKRSGITMHMFFLAVYSLFLQKITQDDEIIIGVPVAGRDQKEVEGLVGLFVNLLAIRVSFLEITNFTELLTLIKEKSLLAYKNSKYPFDLLVNRLSPERDLSRSPIFSSFFQYFEFSPYAQEGVSLYDLSLICRELHGQIELRFEYNTDLFKESTIQRMKSYFRLLVEQIISNPLADLVDLTLLNKTEEELLLSKFNQTTAFYPTDKTIQDIFTEKVAKFAEQIGVVGERRTLTYRELNAQVNRLAHNLREKGVRRDNLVGLLVDRSLEMLIGVLAILKAGGAYLPISPEYPKERITYMLTDSAAAILLTQNKYMEKIKFTGQIIDLGAAKTYAFPENNLTSQHRAEDLAYVIYTSGSTGKPKGVMIEQHSVVNMLTILQNEYPMSPGDTYLLKTAFTFDISVTELFGWFMGGGRLALLSQGGEKEPQMIFDQICRYEVTHINFVPSMLNLFLVSLNRADLTMLNKTLKYLLVCGEVFSKELAKICQDRLPNVTVENIYGPTETTIYATKYSLSDLSEDDLSVSIGQPLNNLQVYVVSKINQLQPLGIPGELCISGPGLARGYLNRQRLTREKFVANPFLPGEKMYKTGDLVKWLSDGNLQFLGRIDQQVKIRGFRVEPEEIESRLLEHSNVKEAIVIAHEGEGGVKELAAYLVTAEKLTDLTPQELRTFLAGRLPEYMIPTYFIQLDKMPLNARGKIDRHRLPDPVISLLASNDYHAPQTETETKMVEIWQNVLQVPQIGINDNFFELGGHSLKATILTGKIHKEFNVEVPLSLFFDQPTVKEIGSYIEQTAKTAYPAIERVLEKEYYQTSSAQKRMYILQQFDLQSTSYNLPGIFEVNGNLDIEKVEAAFQELIRRHEALRTSFKTVDGKIVQKIAPEVDFKVEFSQIEDRSIPEIIDQLVRPFDLSRAPLFRVEQIKLAEDKFLLMFDMHHIITDGFSLLIVVREFVRLYAGFKLAEVKVQYKDYAEWQNKLLKSESMKEREAYWIERFSDQLPVLDLPTDFPRPIVQSFAGEHLNFRITQDLTKELKKLAQEIGCTLYMILLSGINLLLARYSGQEDIIIGSPIAGRSHAELEDTIGIFINTLAMRNYPQGDKSYREFLQEVRDNAIQAYKNQDYQFEELVDRLNLQRDISRNPLFDVMFVMQNYFDDKEFKIDNVQLKPLHNVNRSAKFDLHITANELKDMGRTEEIFLDFEYRTKLFKRDTIARMSTHLQQIFIAVTRDRDCRLKDIQMLTTEERDQLLTEFNDTSADYPAEKTIHQLFFEQVVKRPDRWAVSFNQQHLTYRQLAQKISGLAQLLRKRGVKSETVVAIIMPRSLDMLIGVFSILTAGGAYLPISPEYPEERIQFMLEDSGADLLLTQDEIASRIAFRGETITSIGLTEVVNQAPLKSINTARDLAYVIYTSGSTGRPKGVMVEHRSVINRLHWMQRAYPLNSTDVIMQKTTNTFDVSVWELFWWSFVGAKLTLLSEGGEKDPQEIIDCIAAEKVTVIHFVPSMLYSFLQYVAVAKNEERLNSLRQVFCSGEVLKSTHVELFNTLIQRNGQPKLINLYGPTEATVDVSYYDCSTIESSSTVPIGKPIDNTKLYILDQYDRLQPVGVVGELCIAGVGLARGYWNNPKLTATKFIENPLALSLKDPKEIIYRTGDLARWLPDGNIEFYGRVDQQVKIRGFRIEPGEIEAALLQHAKVREAVVIAASLTEAEADKKLLAYIVLKTKEELVVEEFRGYLKSKLPEHLVPQIYLPLEVIPKKANGKIDLKALPKPGQQRLESGKVIIPPKTATEKLLLEVWSDLLSREQISIDDNFFNLGGDSILGIQVVAKSRSVGLNYSIRELYQYPTINQLAMNLSEPSRAEAAISTEDEIEDFGLLSAEDSKQLQRLLKKGQEGVK